MKLLMKAAALLLPACQLIMVGCAEQPEMMNAEQLSQVKHLAVLPFEDAPGMYGRNSANAVSGFVTTELAKNGKYRVLERSKLKSIIDEQDLQISGLVDQDTAIKVGKMLGADAVVVGAVTQYEMDKTQIYIHMIPIVSKEYTVGATVRMIDVKNGEIIYAHSASGKSPSNFTEAGRLAAQRLFSPLPN